MQAVGGSMGAQRRRGLGERVRALFGRREGPSDPDPGAPVAVAPLERPPRAVERFLVDELRLPLATLADVGRRLALAPADARLQEAAGRALARECERLDVLVTNALELGLVAEPPGSAAQTVLADAVEKAIAGQRAWIEAREIRVRLLDTSCESCVAGARERWVALLYRLLGAHFAELGAGSTVELRLREVQGLVRLDCQIVPAASAVGAARVGAAPAGAGTPAAGDAARDWLGGFGGEFWDAEAGACGFGFALPGVAAATVLAVRRRRPARSVPP